MKRYNNHVAAQSLLQFPAVTHNAPRLAASINRRMRNGTALTTINKSGLVFSGIKKPAKGKSWNHPVLSKNPLNIKVYKLSDKKEGERYFPAFMSDSVKVRLLITEFRKELPYLVVRLMTYCRNMIEQEDTVHMAWPARYIHRFKRWVKLVKRIDAKIAGHGEIVTDPATFSRLLMRGKAQAVIVDFILKYKARSRSREFTRLVKQFFV